MCGICGVVFNDNMPDEKIVQNMLDIIKHRGPDDEGIFTEGKLSLGHRRLSILDLSADGRQPMCGQERYVITYNGEIYNYLELKDELVLKGYIFKTKTDTEVLLAAYDYWKEDCVNHFNGMWAFCIYDKAQKQLFCSRDRFGIKPFYYMVNELNFIFGSEIKQLLVTLHDVPKADQEALTNYLVNGDIDYSERTMFDGVFQLEGGHNLIYKLENMNFRINRWYDLGAVRPQTHSFEQDGQYFQRAFRQSVELRLRADVPVGSCLSGGLDSSAIVCMANRILKEKRDSIDQHVVSSCFDEKRFDEQEFIDEVVLQTGVKCHKVFPDMGKLLSELDQIIWHMDEPFGSTSVFAQWCVFKEAKRNKLTVMLDGQGADEQLAGYTPFYNLLFVDLLLRGKWRQLKHEIELFKAYRVETEPHSMLWYLTKIPFWCLPSGMRRKIGTRMKINANSALPFSKEMLLRTSKIKGVEYNTRSPRKYIYASTCGGLRSLLHYEDRNSMAHSIESRVPFLDVQLVETIFSMPLEYKLRSGETKAVMREGLRGILPEKIRKRHSKLGFVTPEDTWMKENETMIHTELEKACKRLTPMLDYSMVMRWYEQHKSGMIKDSTIIWRMICAAHWADVYNVKMQS